MHSIDSMAPWQVAPVPLTSRIAATALTVLSLDSVFLWQSSPNAVLSATITVIPALVAIRLIRGFPRAVVAAATTFGLIELADLLALARVPGSERVPVALSVAVAAATGGLASILAGWLRSRWAPVIELTRTSETRAAVRAKNA